MICLISLRRAAKRRASDVEQVDVVGGGAGLDQVGDDLPDDGTNLNPCPEKPQATTTCGVPSSNPMTKWSSGADAYMHVAALTSGPVRCGNSCTARRRMASTSSAWIVRSMVCGW